MNNMTTRVIFNLILYKKFTLESLFCFFWNKRPNSPQLLCQTSWLRVKRYLFLLWYFYIPSWCFLTYWIKFTNIGKFRALTSNSIYDHQDSKAPEDLASDPSPGDHRDGMAQKIQALLQSSVSQLPDQHFWSLAEARLLLLMELFGKMRRLGLVREGVSLGLGIWGFKSSCPAQLDLSLPCACASDVSFQLQPQLDACLLAPVLFAMMVMDSFPEIVNPMNSLLY